METCQPISGLRVSAPVPHMPLPQRDKAMLLEKHGLVCHDIALALLRLFPFLICTEGRQHNLSSLGPTQPFGEIYFCTCRAMSSTWLIPEQNQVIPAAEPPQESLACLYRHPNQNIFPVFISTCTEKQGLQETFLLGEGLQEVIYTPSVDMASGSDFFFMYA